MSNFKLGKLILVATILSFIVHCIGNAGFGWYLHTVIMIPIITGVLFILSQDMFSQEEGAKAFLIQIIVILFIGLYWMITSPVFMAESYANLVEKQDIDKKSLTVSYDKVRKVTEAMAFKKANKIIGEKFNGVQLSSQYELDMERAIVQKVKGELLWVIPLDYSGFFKWLKQDSIPGYITLSATDPEDEPKLVLDKKITISNGSYFFSDLGRVAWFKSGFKSVSKHFEIDDNGTPYYIISVLSSKIGFSALGVEKIVILNAETKEAKTYSLSEVFEKNPWIDTVWPEHLVQERIEWFGKYQKGFMNTILSGENISKPTQYKNVELWLVEINDKLQWFTGMTSYNSKDQSMISGILVEANSNKEKPVIHQFDLSGVSDENGAVEVIDSSLGADSIKWNPVLPQPFFYKGEFYWSATIVSDNNVFQKMALFKGNDMSVKTGKTLEEMLKIEVVHQVNSQPDTKDILIREMIQKIDELNELKRRLESL